MDNPISRKASRLKSRGVRPFGGRRLLLSTSIFALALSAGLAFPDAARAVDWTGASSSDWFVTGNWNTGTLPTSGDDVLIATSTPNSAVIAGANATAKNLSIGDSLLAISNGGQLTSSGIGSIGYTGATNGTVTVDGPGSTWTSVGPLYVGHITSGGGTLTVTNGGKVLSGAGYVGYFSGSTGTASIDGAGSAWISNADMSVGQAGTGLLTISNGGHVASVNGLIADTHMGTVTVSGAGSTWTNTGNLVVGNFRQGTLTVTGGGAVTSVNGKIGAFDGSISTATVSGVGSTWTNSGQLTVGDGGEGTLIVSNGGAVSNTVGVVGAQAGSTGTVTVDGKGSTWTNSSDLSVGYSGTGTLTVQNGGAVSSAWGRIGVDSGSTGAVTVDGPGSSWTNSGNLWVGSSGTGTLTIRNGGAVSDIHGVIGAISGSTGTVTVDGPGSSWTNSGDLYVGGDGTGTLTIRNGGVVSNINGHIGDDVGSTGTVTVDGAGSSWTNSGPLSVGYSGTGTVTIQNGGAVSAAWGYIGTNSGSTGTLTVTGNGSAWTDTNGLYVGYDGTGTLNIQNGGVVSSGVALVIASQAGSAGTLNIGGAVGSAPVAAGTLAAAGVTFGLGTGTINFNHTDANYTFGSAIAGVGTINQIAGNTNLIADSSAFTGATYVTGGRLAVNGSLANSLVTVSGGGILGGNGTVGGIIAKAGGIIGPGNSIGTLNVTGNVAQAKDSTYQVELTSTGLSDRIEATGTATIANGAMLSVVKLDAAPYVLGTHYTVLQADGGVSGTYLLTGGGPFIGLLANYDATHVYLDVVQAKSFTEVGLTHNQIAAAGGAESLGSGNALYDAIMGLPTEAAAQDAFDQVSGEVHASANGMLLEDSRFVRYAVYDRLRATFDSVGDANGTPRAVAATAEGLAIWGQGLGSWGHTNGDGNAARLDRSTGGFFTGVDAPVFDTWRFGVIAGYSYTDFDVDDRRSSGSSDNYHVGLYGGSQWGNLALRSGAAYTWHDISTDRSVAFTGFTDSLKSDYNGGTAQVFGELGYGVSAGDVAFEPFANLAYVNLHTDDFTEKGGAAALSGDDATTDATFTTLGLRTSSAFTLGEITATASGMLGWRHAFGDDVPLVSMAFAGEPSFSIGGVPIARDAAAVEAGLDFALSPAATFGMSYGGQFGSGLSDQSVRANVDVKF